MEMENGAVGQVPQEAPVYRRNSTPKMGWEVVIEQFDMGYRVRVGCQTFAFETKEKMLFYLLAYINNPSSLEQKFNYGSGLKFDMTSEDIVYNGSEEDSKKSCEGCVAAGYETRTC